MRNFSTGPFVLIAMTWRNGLCCAGNAENQAGFAKCAALFADVLDPGSQKVVGSKPPAFNSGNDFAAWCRRVSTSSGDLFFIT